MKLNVFINQKKIGILEEISPDPSSKNPNPRILFEYLDSATPLDQISLLMPVSQKRFIYYELPPVFDMILPEGKRRSAIHQAAKITRVDDMGLLSIVGHNAIGRNQVCNSDNIGRIPEINIDAFKLCENGSELFKELLFKSGLHSGISGVQPKLLAAKASDDEDKIRTVTTSTHIIKSFDENEFPWLTVNEYFCLLAARRSGIDVPEFELSKDGHLLAIKRFDLKDEGQGIHYGFEEILSLLGRKAPDKYNGCIEEIISCIDDFIDVTKSITSLKSVIHQTIFNTMIGNGDAHLKNFGLLYDEHSISLSPAYDLICTKAYIKNDLPALALEYENYSKKWWSKDELIQFAKRHCYMTNQEVCAIYERVIHAMETVIEDMHNYIAEHPEFTEVGQQMISIWQSSIHDQAPATDEESDSRPR